VAVSGLGIGFQVILKKKNGQKRKSHTPPLRRPHRGSV